MASSSPPPLKRRLGSFRLALIAFGALAGVLFIGGFGYLRFYGASRVAARAREVEAVRQKGLPTNLAELGHFYLVDPEADRLGKELSQVLNSFKATWEIYGDIHFIDRLAEIGEQPSAENIEILRALLADNTEVLAKLRELVNVPHEVRYPLDFSQGFALEYSFAPQVRHAVRMFGADAQIAALDGDVERVVQDYIDAVRTAETIRGAPILILQLVRIACQSIVLQYLEYSVNSVTIPRDSLHRLREALQQSDLDGAIAYGMIGEICLADISLFLNAAEMRARTAGLFKKHQLFAEIWSANLFLTQSEVMRIGDRPPWERKRAFEEIEQRVMDEWEAFHIFEQMLVPAIGRAYEAETRILGITATTQTGLAVLDYASTTGTLPQNLNALMPNYFDAVPLDPFDGQPLRYHKADAGFVIYSIAHNRIDDGGVPPPEDEKVTETGDLVFRVLDATPYLQQKDAA